LDARASPRSQEQSPSISTGIAHLVGYFGSKLVKKHRSQALVKRCLEKLITGKPWRSTNVWLLGGLFTYAIEQGYIVSNPAHGIRKPADGRREFRLDAEGYRDLGKDLEAD
jgi:hypothetical protein